MLAASQIKIDDFLFCLQSQLLFYGCPQKVFIFKPELLVTFKVCAFFPANPSTAAISDSPSSASSGNQTPGATTSPRRAAQKATTHSPTHGSKFS